MVYAFLCLALKIFLLLYHCYHYFYVDFLTMTVALLIFREH